jgi:hypothetical protein
VDISLVGVFGALIALSYFIPLSVVIGVTEVFRLVWVIQTLAGILLGPYLGGGAAAIGGIVGNLISPSVFGPIAVILPILAALQAGLITWGYWHIATLPLGLLIVVWFALPVGLAAWPMAIYHVLGLIIIVVTGKMLPLMIREPKDHKRIFVGWVMIAYCADITRHMLGNIFTALILPFPAALVAFWGALPMTAVEQILFAVASALIGVPTLLAIRGSRLEIPLTRLGREQTVNKGKVH